jgi:spore coat protein U-like protein
MKNATRIKLAASLILAAIATPSLADTETSSLAVSASVQNTCAIGDGAISFGSAHALAVTAAGTAGTTADVDADSGASISIICTNGASAAITAGDGANGDATARKMVDGAGDFLTYELYTSSARDTPLKGATAIAYTGTGVATTTTSIFGRIDAAALAAAKAGTYSDTVNLTITYAP